MPRRRRDLARERVDTPGHLRAGQECGALGLDVGGEGRREPGLVQHQVAVGRRQDRRHRAAGRRAVEHLLDRLAAVELEGRDVDQARDLRVVARLRDHDAAVRMADEHDGAVLRVDHGPGHRHVVGQRVRRVLHDGDVVALRLEQLVHGLPAAAVDEAAVHEDDVVDALGGRCRGAAGQQAGGGGRGQDRGEECFQFHDVLLG